MAAYAGYRTIRLLDDTAGVDGGRTTAALVVLIISLWVVLVLARPLAGWKLLLVATMAGAVAVIVAVPALATDIFLLHPTPLRVLVAAAIGGAGLPGRARLPRCGAGYPPARPVRAGQSFQ